MNIVEPSDRTTLVLNNAWMPILCISARLAMKIVMTGRAKALDKFGAQHETFDSWVKDAEYFEDQPYMRSASAAWAVPTIIVTTARFFRKHNNKAPTLKELVEMYDYTCQITGKRFKKNWKAHFTREHVIPVSKGGPNEDWNLLPTCKEANALKGDTYPYFDVDGTNLELKVKSRIPLVRVYAREMRNEWKDYALYVVNRAELEESAQ